MEHDGPGLFDGVRLDLLLVLFREVAQLGELRMAVERIVLEAHLGVEAAQLAVLGGDQRIDLEKLHVLGDKGRIELGDNGRAEALRLATENGWV